MNKIFLNFYNLFNNSKLVQYLMFISFTLISFFILKEHVLYRDDARPMLLAMYEKSFSDLFFAIRYDGGPILYHLILWIISKFVLLNPFIIKLIHFIIQILILTTLIFLIKIPNIFRLLILLQIPFIGHLVFVRRYTLAALLIFLFAYFFNNKKHKNIMIYIVLFLLPQTCSHGLFISFGFFVFLVLNRWQKTKKLFHKYDLIYFFSIFLCLIQIIPPPDLIVSGMKGVKPLFTEDSFIFFIKLASDVFLDNMISGIIFFNIILFICLKKYARRKVAVTAFLLSFFIIFTCYFLLGALKYPSLPRHNWLITYSIFSFLLVLTYPRKEIITKANWTHYSTVIITVFSLYNFISFLPEFTKLSSQGKAVAEYLDKNYANKEILTKYESFIESIIVYRKEIKPYFSLGRQKHINYFITNHKSIDFTRFKDFITILKFSDLISDLENTPDELLNTSPIVILSSHLYERDVDLEKAKIKGKYSLKFLADFNGAKYDNFILYQLQKY